MKKAIILLITVLSYTSLLGCDNPEFFYVDCYTKEGYIAASTEKYLDDVIRYSVDKDYEAIQKLIRAGVVFQMKPNVKIHIVDTHLFSGSVKFRLPGYTEILWTVREAIRC
jgi:hypothetical protein